MMSLEFLAKERFMVNPVLLSKILKKGRLAMPHIKAMNRPAKRLGKISWKCTASSAPTDAFLFHEGAQMTLFSLGFSKILFKDLRKVNMSMRVPPFYSLQVDDQRMIFL